MSDITDDSLSYHLGRFYKAGGSINEFMKIINAAKLHGEVYNLSPKSKRRLFEFAKGYADMAAK